MRQRVKYAISPSAKVSPRRRRRVFDEPSKFLMFLDKVTSGHGSRADNVAVVSFPIGLGVYFVSIAVGVALGGSDGAGVGVFGGPFLGVVAGLGFYFGMRSYLRFRSHAPSRGIEAGWLLPLPRGESRLVASHAFAAVSALPPGQLRVDAHAEYVGLCWQLALLHADCAELSSVNKVVLTKRADSDRLAALESAQSGVAALQGKLREFASKVELASGHLGDDGAHYAQIRARAAAASSTSPSVTFQLLDAYAESFTGSNTPALLP